MFCQQHAVEFHIQKTGKALKSLVTLSVLKNFKVFSKDYQETN